MIRARRTSHTQEIKRELNKNAVLLDGVLNCLISPQQGWTQLWLRSDPDRKAFA